MSAPREVPIRDSAPPQSSRTFEGSQAPSSWSSNLFEVSRHSPSDVWAGAISRLQTQVSLNTSMLESHRKQLQDVDVAVRNLNSELGNVFAALHEIRTELRARPSVPPPSRHDAGDLEVLAGQVEQVASKANEVDGLKMQVDLLRNRMKRWEEQEGSAMPSLRPRASSGTRDSTIHELPPSTYLDRTPHHQPLPPMRTTEMASPIESRTAGLPGPHAHTSVPVLESQSVPRYSLSMEPRHFSESSRTMQPSSAGSFRSAEPLPPPSSLPGWRASDSLHHSGLPVQPPTSGYSRPDTLEPEPQTRGWATVNANQPGKRPYEEPRPSPYGSPGSGSPKRPKLAPIMPRSSYGDDSYVPSNISQSGAGEMSNRPNSRATSDVSQSHSRMILTPDSASAGSYRFITSTAEAESQESWRPENQRRMHPHAQGPQGGRNRGRRGGRGGGRRGRGGGVQLPESQKFGTPEWGKTEWTGSQISPNGFYHPLHPYAHRGGRGGLVKRGGGGADRPPDHDQDHPETPVQGPEDPAATEHLEGGLHPNSAGKKTRTKPIRNAEGVLIRKDGRPDMRSVSSANNLRKVHAKKDAERADLDGPTPTSARSLAPMDNASDDEEERYSNTPGTPGEQEDTEAGELEQQQSRGSAEQRGFDWQAGTEVEGANRNNLEEAGQPAQEAQMKVEDGELRQDIPDHQRKASSQMSDVVMREMSDAQAEEHRYREDIRMETIGEAREEKGGEDGDRAAEA